MNDIAVACAQLTWKDVPRDQVFAEIAQAGYAGAPAGPRWFENSAEATLSYFARYALKPAPGYYSADFWKSERREDILSQATTQAEFARAVGLSELYVAAGGFDGFVTPSAKNRKQIAANVGPGDGLDDAQYRQFAATLNEFGQRTLELGVKSCFHNHVGSVIESLEECERLLELTDPALVFLGPDTGHLAWAGIDVVPFCKRHLSRIKTLHLKDVNFVVRDRGKAEAWEYDTFTKNGVFAELGEGNVDFPGLLALLRESGFGGWVVVETDVTQKTTALESAIISRNYLKSLGL